MLGNNIIAQVVSMFDWMPAIILTSKLCPKNMESTVYALLAGFQVGCTRCYLCLRGPKPGHTLHHILPPGVSPLQNHSR